MDLSDLRKYLNGAGLPAGYSVNTDATKGDGIKGFDQLSINWKDNCVSKSVQIFPEISGMNIKRWKLGVYASIDSENGRQFWTETLVVKKSKAEIIAVALEEIKKGIERLRQISLKDLESTKY